MPHRVLGMATRARGHGRGIGLVLAVMVVAVGAPGCTTHGGTETTTSAAASTTATPTSVPAASILAVWPAAPTGFDSPESAARDFIRRVLGVTPRIGSFMAGDSTSGEIDVFIGEDLPSVPDVSKGTLILRRINGLGWFVMAAAHRFNGIESPIDRARLPAGTVTVTGRARGFEGQVSVIAYLPAKSTASGAPVVVDSVSTIAGSGATPIPFTVSLDLTSVAPESVVAILVRGGRGLEQDPGEFSAVPVVVGAHS